MRVFFKSFHPLSGIINTMKSASQPPEYTDKTPIDNMAMMQALLSEKDDLLKIKSEVIEKQKERIKALEEYLNNEKSKRFAPSSEKSTVEQGELFNEVEVSVEPEQEELFSDQEPPSGKKSKTGRKPFAKNIPRTQIFAYLTDAEKEGAIDTFFTKVREELDIIPAKVQILEYMQEKAVFKDDAGNKHLKAAEVCKHPIPKAMGSVNLMTYIVISKYADGLPLYRLANIIKRYGGELSRATLANWMMGLSRQVQPLINLMRDHQHAGSLIMADETRVQVLKEPNYSATGDKYMWVTLGGPPLEQSVLFEYDPSRGREIPLRLLDGFKDGYLQTDGYAGYNEVCKKNNLTHLGCWDHARRKFKDAEKAQPKGKKVKASKADQALSYINALYRVERGIKLLSDDEKLEIRQQRTVPILNKLRAWLDNHRAKITKDSLTGKAMTYLHNQWEKLIVYCTDGRLNISNIQAENAIRPFAVGRRAWLFSDTPAGANASAVHYSLIETAKLHQLEPYDYLNAIFKALPYAESVEDIEALLPWNYKARIAST